MGGTERKTFISKPLKFEFFLGTIDLVFYEIDADLLLKGDKTKFFLKKIRYLFIEKTVSKNNFQSRPYCSKIGKRF